MYYYYFFKRFSDDDIIIIFFLHQNGFHIFSLYRMVAGMLLELEKHNFMMYGNFPLGLGTG